MFDRTKDPLDGVGQRHVTRLGAAAIAAALVLTACGGSSKPKASSTTTSQASSTTTSTSPSGAALTGEAATIKDVYNRFLDLSIPVDQKLDLIQDGADFKVAMEAEAKNPAAKNIGLQVSDVKLSSANLATVTYTILVSGSPLLADQHGYAIKENGKWKIAGVTFCGLLAAQGPSSVPPACAKPAATALPTR